jgi:hypothetical protein
MMEIETIKDSGDRRQFGTGAVRDMACKGRCDLLPWDVIPGRSAEDSLVQFCDYMSKAVHHIELADSIRGCLDVFVDAAYFGSYETALLDVAFHYEAGAKKYSARNYELGIPVDVFLDSAGRHYLKWLRGDKDECHDRAVVWNLLSALWMIKHHPEMVDKPVGG